jgi:hypothetical protein
MHFGNSVMSNLAFNLRAVGFGADYRVRPSFNVRADYELQQWPGFPPNGLSGDSSRIGNLCTLRAWGAHF